MEINFVLYYIVMLPRNTTVQIGWTKTVEVQPACIIQYPCLCSYDGARRLDTIRKCYNHVLGTRQEIQIVFVVPLLGTWFILFGFQCTSSVLLHKQRIGYLLGSPRLSIFWFISFRDLKQSFMSLRRGGLQCFVVFMIITIVDHGLQELQRFWEEVAGLSH